MGVHAARRLVTFPYLGPHAYSVTCCAFARRPTFLDKDTVADAATQLLHISGEERFAVLAYCFMPDHVHLLVEGASASSDLARLLARWKQRTGYTHTRVTGERLWQGGFYDHVLREGEDRLALIRYILGNPLRAGLVKSVVEYPFWGSGVWSRDELIDTLFDG